MLREFPLPAAMKSQVTAVCLLAPNPGLMTLEGTNTWLLAVPGASEAVVVDPGPSDEAHLAAVLAATRERGLRVTQVLLTHGHHDHSEGAPRFGQLAAAPVRALDPRHTIGAPVLADGEVIEVGGLRIEVIFTPGHSSDSLCFHLPEQRAVLTGDTVLGRGSTVVAHPDGRLADYLASLRRLERLVTERAVEQVLPGHGPMLALPQTSPVDAIRGYLQHRQQRLQQVRDALEAGARTPREVVERVYADISVQLWTAAEQSVAAQLGYLRENRG